MSLELKQIITQIIAFLLMLWILKRFAWKPMLALLDARTQKIKASFDDIADKNKQADNRLADYNRKIDAIKDEGQVIIQNAVKDSRKIAQEIQMEAQKKGHDIIIKAQEEAGLEMKKAQSLLKKDVIERSFQAFEKLLQMKLTKEEKEQYALKLMDEV